ncbi:MAG: type III-B CRISPR module-associated protein Cmr5 [Armatimonadota bacterium]|nr:type III-B CRISPR module-associated protein Cmr5 [Armatimonadota bacterium]
MPGVVDRDVVRAQKAYEAVVNTKGKASSDSESEFRSQYTGLPSLLHNHGLFQTVAFLMSREDDCKPQYQRAWEDLMAGTLDGCSSLSGAPTDLCRGAVLHWMAKLDSLQHRLLSSEALAYSAWLKRWAEVLLEARKDADRRGEVADQSTVRADDEQAETEAQGGSSDGQ